MSPVYANPQDGDLDTEAPRSDLTQQTRETAVFGPGFFQDFTEITVTAMGDMHIYIYIHLYHDRNRAVL